MKYPHFSRREHILRYLLGKQRPEPRYRVGQVVNNKPEFLHRNQYRLPFSQVRGGVLTVSVSVRVGNQVLSARSEGLSIAGTNPPIGKLGSYANADVAFRKLMRLESQLRQFTQATGMPLFSGDNKGGVGLCQITDPAPSADQIWNWKANVDAGWALYQQKRGYAAAYPRQTRNSAAFKALVAAYNEARPSRAQSNVAQALGLEPARLSPLMPVPSGLPRFGAPALVNPADLAQGRGPLLDPPVNVTLPDYNAAELARDTLRAFNGWAAGLHEYRVRLDAQGLLVVTEDASGRNGTAQWERVSANDRIAHYDAVGLAANKRGDPAYVDHVEAQAPF